MTHFLLFPELRNNDAHVYSGYMKFQEAKLTARLASTLYLTNFNITNREPYIYQPICSANHAVKIPFAATSPTSSICEVLGLERSTLIWVNKCRIDLARPIFTPTFSGVEVYKIMIWKYAASASPCY